DQLSELTLLEAAELKKVLEEKWGVTAAAPMAMAAMPMGGAAGGAAAAAPVEEQAELDVVITDVGSKKINIIKEVHALTSLGLKETNDLIEATSANGLS